MIENIENIEKKATQLKKYRKEINRLVKHQKNDTKEMLELKRNKDTMDGAFYMIIRDIGSDTKEARREKITELHYQIRKLVKELSPVPRGINYILFCKKLISKKLKENKSKMAVITEEQSKLKKEINNATWHFKSHLADAQQKRSFNKTNINLLIVERKALLSEYNKLKQDYADYVNPHKKVES